MELNEICEKLELYKLTHPNLYFIINNYIEQKNKAQLLFLKNLKETIDNLKNISDITSQEIILLNSYLILNNYT